MNDHDNSRVLLVDTQDPHPARKRARALTTPWRSRKISIAVSPDGRWAAAGSWNDPGVYVWDLPRRRFERVLPRGDTVADGHTLPAFSPDGRWLVVNSAVEAASGYYFWEVGTWKRGPYIPRPTVAGWGEPIFSPDGALIALSVAANQVRLYEMATGRTIAHLTTLEALAPAPLAFSPDGTRLIASTNRQTALIWDLRRIRERLRTMDLDWDQPPYPPEEASPGASLPPIRSIRVLGEAPEPAARRAAELAACEARLREHPDDVEALLDRGWLKLKMSKPAEAIPDLERGLQLRPDDSDALYLLAEAQIADQRSGGGEGDPRDIPDACRRRCRCPRLERSVGARARPSPGSRRRSQQGPRSRPRPRSGEVRNAPRSGSASAGSRTPWRTSICWSRAFLRTRTSSRCAARSTSAWATESRRWPISSGPPCCPRRRRSSTTIWPGGWPPARPHCAIPRRRWSSPGRPSRRRLIRPSTSIRWASPSTARANLPRPSPPWRRASRPARANPTPSTCSFWPCPAIGSAASPKRADFDRAVEWRRHHPNLPDPRWSHELDDFQAEARDLLDGPASELPADVFAPSSGP